METVIAGVVGVLQLDVLEHRLLHEYNVELVIARLELSKARWIISSPKDAQDLNLTSQTKIVKDILERNVLLFDSDWAIEWAMTKNKGLELADIMT